MATQTYLIALGSNVGGRWGTPHRLLSALLTRQPWSPDGASVGVHAVDLVAASEIHASAPMGAGKRRYANAVAIVETPLMPPALLVHLKSIERAYGRRSGRRWGNRVLDLDIIGWSGGIWRSRTLQIPHPAFRTRRFVLAPLVELAAGWRDPVTGLAARHLLARLDRGRPHRVSPPKRPS